MKCAMTDCIFHIAVDAAALDVTAEITALQAADTGADCANGAVACFVGRVRGGEVQAMTLEHYPRMTEQALADIAAAAAARWQLAAVRVVHRVGRLLPGEGIVFIGVLSRHRAAAFSACEYIADYLKTEAPFWKKEETADGARWVAARGEDAAARDRWRGGGDGGGSGEGGGGGT